MNKILTLRNYRFTIYFLTFSTLIYIGVFVYPQGANDMYGIMAGSEETITDTGYKFLGAGIAAIGMLGAGIGQGYAAGKAAEAVGRNPEAEAKIRNTLIIGASIAETGALYAFVVSILLIFVA